MMEYTLFGESHGGVVGVVLEHVPAGIPVDDGFTAAQLLRRAPRGAAATPRRETDEVAYLSGVFEGKTTGMPLVAVLRNGDVRPGDYEALRCLPRPGHADYAAFVRASGHQDYRGGGHYSGRLTAPLVVAGALALTYLKEKGIAVSAHVVDEANLRTRAEEARTRGDSVGGQVACTVTGLPAGLGGPDYRDAVESEIARHVFAIPAVKALGFGSGEALASMEGSQANDPLRTDGERIYTTSNHAGGINGGVTNGMPVTFTVTFRPTPSIALPQDTVDLSTMTNATVTVHGRHDSCVALRAASAVESAAALALCALVPAEETEIADLRRRIDAIDSQITTLLVERLQTAERIGQYKKDRQMAVQDGGREAEVLRTRGDWAGPYRDAVEQVFRTVMAQAREVQK